MLSMMVLKRQSYIYLVPFAGSYKQVVGSYDISQLWYIRQKFEKVTDPSLVSKPIPDASDNCNEDELGKVANGNAHLNI